MRRIIYVLLCLYLPVPWNFQGPGSRIFPILRFSSYIESGSYRKIQWYYFGWPAITVINGLKSIMPLSLQPFLLMEISWQIRLPIGDAWGVGLMTMTDRTANGILTSNYVAISTAYQKALDENGWNQIGIGFQGSYASKRLDGTN